MLKLGLVKETEQVQSIGSGRPARLYTFDPKKYKELEESGVPIELGLKNLYLDK